jgi:YD repeat-containing protein
VPPGGWAANGNLLASSDSVMGDWAYQYDTLNRLTTTAPALNAPGAFQFSLGCYAYDPFGNRTLNVTNYSWDNGCSGYAASDYNTYNTKNQATTVNVVQADDEQTPADNVVSSNTLTYDAAGNVTNDGVNAYVYDSEGRLCAVGNRGT